MPAQTLLQLEGRGVVLRHARAVVPPHVDDRLTPLQVAVAIRVVALSGWIDAHLPQIMAGQADIAAE